MATVKPKAKPRKVDFLMYDEDYRTAFLAAMGMSTRFIERSTGLSPCQIGYRKHKAGIRVTDYRNGDSWVARAMLKTGMDVAGHGLSDYLKRFSPDYHGKQYGEFATLKRRGGATRGANKA